MGLLDEAIKEHLDLKRRRGADPDDVAREEREALGPAVREVRESMGSAEGPPTADASADGVSDVAEAAPPTQVDEASPVPEEPTPAAEEPAPAQPEEPGPSVDQATQVFDAEDLFAEEDVPVPDPEAPGSDEVRH